MPETTTDQRLEDAIRRRTEILAHIERIKGKKEAAESNLKAAEEACRSRKVDPDDIDGYIEKLETRYEQLVSDLERDIEDLEEQLAPFLGDADGEEANEDRSSEE